MTSLKFIFYLTCLFLGKIAQQNNLKSPSYLHQVGGFISVEAGDNVTLQCFHNINDVAWLFWYKQTLGEKPKLISSFYVYDTRITFNNEFKNDKRFTLHTKNNTNTLLITNLTVSDSATYYCANSITFVVSFAEGTVVSVREKDLNNQAVIHQSASETVKPGGSVTLNCTIKPGTCDEGHIVYWFKASGETYSGITFTHEDNNHCDKKPETNTCFYNLQLKSLNRSHTGTYYCAVASCGKILFGNGTNVDIEDEVNSNTTLMYFLSGALTFTTILAVFTVYKIIKTHNCQCRESQAELLPVSATNTEGYQDPNNLFYAALSGKPLNRSRQRNTTKSECVYSSVKL
ncbi:immunoglobulin kappa light chain-like [Channa argus]|uniref:immunoglobulin kappa light chain-like n=1 Tax=Channa argus TaxID=215402 RepID=UPI0035230A00